MARLARVIAVGVAHHVTQRGNARRFLLEGDTDRRVYLDLLQQHLMSHDVLLVGFCLMSNHVHLIVIPNDQHGLALSLKHTHGRYASYWNMVHHSSGHAWQGRYYSCPLDQEHLWAALRYTELNPVRAKLVTEPNLWAWSSAAAHCDANQPVTFLSTGLWQRYWTHETWSAYLAAGEPTSDLAAIRQCTHTGRPLGGEDFVHSLEVALQRCLLPQKGGRPQNLDRK